MKPILALCLAFTAQLCLEAQARTRGLVRHDNVSIEAIPAPSAASLMLLGVSVACGRGRRSSRRA